MESLIHKIHPKGLLGKAGDIEKQGITIVPISLDFKGPGPVKNLPTTIIIDPRGKEIRRVEGPYEWNSKEVTDYLFPFAEHKPK
ncbi:MAG: hypothetical protein IPP74_06415 [Alphaproteobacteria bacterium]|nr:hypothetical protein [Alphaproteobacteria bacterium]